MLVRKNFVDKSKTIYACDRCGQQMVGTQVDKYRISAQSIRKRYATIKSWHLCKKCFLLLCKGIEKGVTPKNGTDIQCKPQDPETK